MLIIVSYAYNKMQQSGNSEWNEAQEKKRKNMVRFQCDSCRKKFKTQIKLNQHIRKQHNSMSVSVERSANNGARGRPKQNIYKRFDAPEEKDNPLKELKMLQQKVGQGTINPRDRYEKDKVWELITEYMKEKDEPNKLEVDKEVSLYACSLGKGLAILIEEISRFVTDEQFKEQLYLLLTYYIGYVIEETEDSKVLKNGSIALLPEFANLFIMYDLCKRTERFKINDRPIFQPNQVVKILHLFCRWLNYKKFTHTLATINEEFLEEDAMSEKIEGL